MGFKKCVSTSTCRVPMAWKSHGKWFLFSRPGIVMEFVKKVTKVMESSWIFQTLILIIKNA